MKFTAAAILFAVSVIAADSESKDAKEGSTKDEEVVTPTNTAKSVAVETISGEEDAITVTVDPTGTGVDINQFSALYNGPYSSDMVSYALYLAGVGFDASKIELMLTKAYRYGSDQIQDQSSYDSALSQWVIVQDADVSDRATRSYSFKPEETELMTFSDEEAASRYLATHKEGDDDSKSDDKDGDDDKKTTDGKNKDGDDKKTDSKDGDKSKSDGGADSTDSKSEKDGAMSFAAPIGAALGAIAVALL